VCVCVLVCVCACACVRARARVCVCVGDSERERPTYPVYRQYNSMYVFVWQVSLSDSRNVTLLNVQKQLTGFYKCEVSADAPLFHTEIKSASMTVVGKYHPNANGFYLRLTYFAFVAPSGCDSLTKVFLRIHVRLQS